MLAEVFLHVVSGDVHDGLHVPDTGLRVHKVRDHRRHGRVVHAVAVAPKVHGERVRRATRERGRFAFDHVRVDRLLKEYRQLYRRVQAGRRHRMHQRVAARQVRSFVRVRAALSATARVRRQPERR